MVSGGSGIGPERALERRHPDPPSRDSAKAPPVPTFPASAGPIPRSLTATQPHRDSATIARPATQPAPKNLNPSAKRKPKRPIPKDQQIATHHARTGGSGIGPERALEAITLTPRAQRESSSCPNVPCERRPDPAEPHRDSAPSRLSPMAEPATQPHTRHPPDHLDHPL